ncbi:MAG: FAD-binding oxidoreductase, partial [Candidatus Saccharimonadales bacterium]
MARTKKADILKKLNKQLRGKVYSGSKTLFKYSHDTSLFEIIPQAVVFPKDANDLKELVEFVKKYRKIDPNLSLTARSAGTDMSGGAINDSIIVGFEKYFTKLGKVNGKRITAQSGVYYRKFEKRTLKAGKILPSFPASKHICAIGGMVANNAGGEKSLTYGKTEKYVRKLKVVLNDGNQYTVKPLNKKELDKKLAQKDFEGQIYKKLYNLIEKNYELIQNAKPKVTKNSTGYKLWDVWDRQKGIFDLTQIFVGSQGTLGLVTETEFELVEAKKHTGMLVGFVRGLERLGELNNHILKHAPTSVEVFDDHTLNFALRFFLQFRKTLGWRKFIKLAFSFLPDIWLLRKGWPKLIVLIEFEADKAHTVRAKVGALRRDLEESEFEITLENADSAAKSERFWLMRRESFNLLRKNVKGKHTAPFIDDLVV